MSSDAHLPGGWGPGRPQRLPGLADDEIVGRARAALEAWWPPYNIHRVLARGPATLESWIGFGTHILRQNLLGERLRELVVLRVAWNSNCAYEWGQHARLSGRIGIPEAVIARVAAGPDDAGWLPVEAAIIRSVDEMMSRWSVSDDTYGQLVEHLSAEQLIDHVFLVGEFILVALVLNVFRIEPDPGLPVMPAREGSRA